MNINLNLSCFVFFFCYKFSLNLCCENVFLLSFIFYIVLTIKYILFLCKRKVAYFNFSGFLSEAINLRVNICLCSVAFRFCHTT